MRITNLTIGVAVILAAAFAEAQQSVPLRVTATVPPRPCEYPQPCAPAPLTTTSKVTVSNEQVRYIGTTPSVSRQDDVLSIKF